MRPCGTSKQLEKRRRLAIHLLNSGYTFQHVANRVDSSVSSLVRWRQAYLRHGLAGLKSKPIPGRPSLLSRHQKEKLQRILLSGPVASGFPTDVWTLKRMGKVIARRFGINYSIGQLWNLMNPLKRSRQKTKRHVNKRIQAKEGTK